MVKLLSAIFLKGRDITTEAGRRAYGTLCSVLGIFLNILLFAGKLTAGLLTGSIAITADAFNNIADAGSSVITLIGFRFAGMKPDTKHPFGHGRFEYLSGLLVSIIIIIVGFELLTSSVEKILHPEAMSGNGIIAIIILAASILVKGYMFFYNRRIGKKINSSGMKATAIDSISDCAATTVVLISAIVGTFTDLSIDGWCGAAVSLFVLFSGFKSAYETLQPLLGESPDEDFVKDIESSIMEHKMVLGIHDMIVHDYGPGRQMISVHAEVDGKENIFVIHDEIDLIEQELYNKFGCDVVIHMDPIETDNEVIRIYKSQVSALVKELYKGSTIHDFRMVPGPTHTNLIFDAVIPYEIKDTEDNIRTVICSKVSDNLDKCLAVIKIDRPFTKQ